MELDPGQLLRTRSLGGEFILPCAFWPGRDQDRYTGPWNRWTSAPLLVVNNRYDPSTPLHGARDATAQLARARLFIVEGAGHTGMYVPSTCAERVKREYLFTGAHAERSPEIAS